MRHIIYTQSDTYPTAVLIKESAFNTNTINKTYINPLIELGLQEDNIIVYSLKYDKNNKASAALMKEYLVEELLPSMAEIGVKNILCTDANYFKALTKNAKTEPCLGYKYPCKIKDYENFTIVLGINYKTILFNPANQSKMDLTLNTFYKVIKGSYSEPGKNVIHSAEYPKTVTEIKTALHALADFPELACDIETFSLKHDKAGIATITFCWSEHEGIAFACDYQELPEPVDGMHGQYLPNPEVRALIKAFFISYTGRLRWHNCSFDLKICIATLWMKNLSDTAGLLEGLHIVTKSFDDTKVIAYLATNSTAGNHLSLKELAHEFAGDWGMGDNITDVCRIPLPKLLKYNVIDGLCTNYVYNKFYPKMVKDQQLDLYTKLFMPSQKTIIQMELTGMPLNPVRVPEVKTELLAIENTNLDALNTPFIKNFNKRLQKDAMIAANAKLKVKQHPITAFEHHVFNPNSPPQLQKLLYEAMELPVIDLTKTKQPATGAKTLNKLINHTTNVAYKEILTALINLAQVSKILTTFIPIFEKGISHGTEIVYIHGNFNLGGTVSGRLSSSGPNLQNMPSGSKYGKLIKSCFIAPKGFVMAGADFNSLEDYISALTTRDPNKLKVYTEGYDGHCLRAFSYFPDRLPGIVDTVASINSIAKKFPEVRQDSKAPTFALTYQGMWITLMNRLGWTKEKSKSVEARFKDLYAASIEWVNQKLIQASTDGYVTVAFGLRVRTPLLGQTLRGRNNTPFIAEAEGRTAGNALGQSYGLLNNRACNEFMQKVWASPYATDILPIAMIHDAIYLVIKDDISVVHWVNKELIKSMQWQDLPELHHDTVKLGAELSIFHPTWADEVVLPNYASTQQILNTVNLHKEAICLKAK